MSSAPGQSGAWNVGFTNHLSLKGIGAPLVFCKNKKTKTKNDKAVTGANMGGVSAQVHSIRESCSRKWQVRGGAGMECHRPDEKPQEGSITMLSSSSSSFSHSSSSGTLKCPHLGTEGVKKVMGEAQLPSLPSSPPPTPSDSLSPFCGSVTFKPIERTGRGKAALGWGKALESGC